MIKIFEAETCTGRVNNTANMLNRQIDEWIKTNPKLEIAIEKTELAIHTYKKPELSVFVYIRYVLVIHYST